MRISDWSSDVCSSDLYGVFRPQQGARGTKDKRGARGRWFTIAAYNPNNWAHLAKHISYVVACWKKGDHMGFIKKDINQNQLVVDTSNFRLGEQESVRGAYQAMIEEEGANLANLVEDIVEIGLSPAESLIVIKHPELKNKYTSIEGNRRITALRLLQTPALAAGTSLHKKFIELSKKYAAKPIEKVSCVVFDDKEEAFKWMERKHLRMDGRGLRSETSSDGKEGGSKG